MGNTERCCILKKMVRSSGLWPARWCSWRNGGADCFIHMLDHWSDHLRCSIDELRAPYIYPDIKCIAALVSPLKALSDSKFSQGAHLRRVLDQL